MEKDLFIGIDVGGTKISAAVVTSRGKILARSKRPTPRKAAGPEVIEGISENIGELLKKTKLRKSSIKGVGMGVPGIFAADRESVLTSPNLSIDGFAPAREVKRAFNLPAAADNDVNVGLIGERWLGAAREANNIIGIFPGTGIGGAVILGGEMYTGFNGAGTEIGHMIVHPGGDKCGCGNRGCLEAVASRLAIERDILKALKAGQKSALTDILGKKPQIIKSGPLKKALKLKDPLVTRVMTRAAREIGLLCVSLRHLLDPELLLFGGGLVEACGFFILPIIEKTVKDDPYFKKVPPCRVVKASLGDDAAILGAAALIQKRMGLKLPEGAVYPSLRSVKFGELAVDEEVYSHDIFIRADGKVKKRGKKLSREKAGYSHTIGLEELKKVCKKDPEILFIASGHKGLVKISAEGRQYLKRESIGFEVLPTPKAIESYNKSKKRKAILAHITC